MGRIGILRARTSERRNMINVSRVSRETVKLRAYEALKRAILAGQFRPGEALTLRAIGERLGTSDMPIREALYRLVAERALESLPNRSPRIPVLDTSQLIGILELRIMLEGMSAERAAAVITPAQLDDVKTAHVKANDAFRRQDPTDYLRWNTEFHFSIYRACPLVPLLPMIESLWLQYAPTFAISMERTGAMAGKLDEHDAVIDALAVRDGEAAKRALQTDIRGPSNAPGFWEALNAKQQRLPTG
jgi:DNA-binding GntR family transcriptional regulator